MKNNINIVRGDQTFSYIIEYIESELNKINHNVGWKICDQDDKCVHLIDGNVEYYRHNNEWYPTSGLSFSQNNVPESVALSKLRVHIPIYNIGVYERGIKYALSVNTWISSNKIDLGTFIFRPNDTLANNGVLKRGNNEYMEYVEFDIIDPFNLIYSDEWAYFREEVCGEITETNSGTSTLQVSLYVIEDYNDRYAIKDGIVGGVTCFNISKSTDFLSIDLSEYFGESNYGLNIDLNLNSKYNDIFEYLKETYYINTDIDNCKFELVIKNKDSVIPGPAIDYNADGETGFITQKITVSELLDNNSFKTFFSSWNEYEYGWSIVASFIVEDENKNELFTLVSNELPITQDVFSRFLYNGSEKIIDTQTMQKIEYNIVNKIENKIVQIERPNDSKMNIIQPVFFRVKDAETLTLHPDVNENVCINLDDYKSKVEKFILKIDSCTFNQIGANNYGVIFKVFANTISSKVESGTYYILDENMDLVTTGKFNCVR